MNCPGPDAVGVGAYVLGALDADERRRVEEHAGACPECAARLAEFRSLPALLDRVSPEDLQPVLVAPSPDLFARTAAAADTGRRGRLRSRTWALVAAAVLAVLGAGVAVGAAGPDEQRAVASAGPVSAQVTASPEEDGVVLDVAVAGLRPGETCSIVAIDRNGDRHPAGDWPASPEGDGRWVGWASIEADALDEVVFLGDGGRELVRVDL